MLFVATAAFAQAKPSFAGKWTLDPASVPAPAAPAPEGGGGGGRGGGGRGGGRGGGLGMELTITQDATTLTLEYAQGQNPVKLVYKLDGTESKNMMMGRGGQTEQVAKASWDANTVVIVTTTAMGDQTRKLSLEGGNLVVATTPPGGTETKVTYKKGV
jgi:hypothetical protein